MKQYRKEMRYLNNNKNEKQTPNIISNNTHELIFENVRS